VDYLAFGLLAGSLIVIASFVVRDALPHLTAISRDSRLARASQASSPMAWARWCADAGLVLAAAGTLVLAITVATLLADLSDDAGNVVVGLSVAVAVAASVLGAVRLWQRLREDAAREMIGEARTEAGDPALPNEAAAVPAKRAVETVERDDRPSPREVAPAVDQPGDVWDDDLSIWSPSPSERQQPIVPTLAEVSPDGERDVASEAGLGSWGSVAGAAAAEPPRTPLPNRGLFSSPLLADIGPSPVEEVDDGFRSPLLSDLQDGHRDDGGEGDDIDPDGGFDLLLDEAPAPVGSSGRHRDGMDDR